MGFTKVCIGMAMSAAVGLSIILSFAGPYIYKLFTKDPLVIEKGMEILHFLVPAFCTYVLIEIFSGSLRGMGNSFIPMLLTGLGICAFRVLWIFIVVPIWHDVRMLIFSYPLSWTITTSLFIFYFRRYTNKQQYLRIRNE